MAGHGRRSECFFPDWSIVGGILTAIPNCGVRLPVFVRSSEEDRVFSCRDVDQASGGIKRHGVPVVSTTGRWGYKYGLPAIVSARRFLWAPSFRIDTRGPSDAIDERFCGDELAGLAIEHVEESVLRGLHNDLARTAADRQIREHQGLRGVVVPIISGRNLIVPNQLAVARAQRQDGSEVQVVATAGAAEIAEPGDSVSRAGVHQIEVRVVDDGVPRRTSAPPIHHWPCQVFAAASMALDSKPLAGSPGTVKVRQR